VAGSQKIDDDKNTDEKHDHQETVGAYARRATGGKGFQAAEMDDKQDDEAEKGRSFQEGNEP
jgi:hypothetical protein